MLNYIYKYISLIFFVLLLSYSAKVNWNNGQWQHVLEADAKGYYSYLPAIFVYNDLNFSFFNKIENKNTDPLYYDYRSFQNGKFINKYYFGTALCMSPFFLISQLINYLFSFENNGYNQINIIFLCISTCFYSIVGIFFLKKTLEQFSQNKFLILITLFSILFGTNLFYYIIGEPGFSHVYSFCFFSIFIYLILKYFKDFNIKYLYLSVLILSLIVLIRPINIIVIFFIPFLSGNFHNLKNGLKTFISKKKYIIITFIIICIFPFLQLIIYKIQTNQFIIYSYGEEGFNFSNPKFLDFLFSYKKGYFLYTPIGLFALIGLLSNKLNKFQKFTFLFFITFIIYLLSSWWMWYYGGSYSSRVMIDFSPVFAILLLVLFDELKRKFLKNISYLILFSFIILNQFQTLQYRYFIIHWSEMTKEKYWEVFLDINSLKKAKNNVQKSSYKN
jgi:hypothetical protein